MLIYELKQKEVINTGTCKTLGYLSDVEINPYTGQLLSLVVPGPSRFYSFLGHDSEYRIPWNCIRKIGEDIILVEINEESCLRKI